MCVSACVKASHDTTTTYILVTYLHRLNRKIKFRPGLASGSNSRLTAESERERARAQRGEKSQISGNLYQREEEQGRYNCSSSSSGDIGERVVSISIQTRDSQVRFFFLFCFLFIYPLVPSKKALQVI